MTGQNDYQTHPGSLGKWDPKKEYGKVVDWKRNPPRDYRTPHLERFRQTLDWPAVTFQCPRRHPLVKVTLDTNGELWTLQAVDADDLKQDDAVAIPITYIQDALQAHCLWDIGASRPGKRGASGLCGSPLERGLDGVIKPGLYTCEAHGNLRRSHIAHGLTQFLCVRCSKERRRFTDYQASIDSLLQMYFDAIRGKKRAIRISTVLAADQRRNLTKPKPGL